MTTRYFELSEGSAHKFWEITLSGSSHTVRYGRIGTRGQAKTKDFVTEEKARASHDKLIAEKTRKGYAETENATAGSAPALAAPATKPAGTKPAGQKPAGQKPAGTNPAGKAASAATAKPAKASTRQPTPEPTAKPPGASAAKASEDTQGADDVNLSTERQIRLAPRDWQRATWRPRTPIEEPTPPPFDLASCEKRRKKVSYWWDASSAKIVYPMSPEEATFWLRVIGGASHTTNRTGKHDPVDDAPIRQEEIEAAFEGNEYPCIIPALAALMGPRRFIEQVLAAPEDQNDRWGRDGVAFIQTQLIPSLADDDLAALRALAAQVLADWSWRASSNLSPFRALVAAALGPADALREGVASWADDEFIDPYSDYYRAPQVFILALGSAAEVETAMRRFGRKLRSVDDIRGWLANTEHGALDLVSSSIREQENKEDAAKLLEAFAVVESPEAAGPMLALMLDSKAPHIARAWLHTHVAHGIVGLLPIAAQGSSKLGAAALRQLTQYKRRGFGDLILSLAGDHAELAAQIVHAEEREYAPFERSAQSTELQAAFADADAAKIKGKDPFGWIVLEDLPVLLVGDRAVQGAELQSLFRALALSTPEAAHPLVQALRPLLDPTSRDEFAWALFQCWLTGGADSKSKWALLAVGLLGGDGCALRLAPLVRVWPGESQHQRAVLGLESLRLIGTDTALMQLNGIAQKLKFKALKAKARDFMTAIATERGMTRDELEDLIVPDCDLDARGTRVFDFGPRQFHFVMGPDLKPMVRGEDGKLRPNLPKPAKKDDATKADPAVAEWKVMKKMIREVAKTQGVRLEQSMITGRRWDRDRFETHLVQHPLMTNLSRQLVWATYGPDGSITATFRVTDEQDYSDAADEVFTLPDDAQIGIAHAAHLSEADRQAWGELFADYEIVPPFAQLSRPVLTLEAAEREASEITRFDKIQVPAITLVGILERQGWERGIPQDAGFFYEHTKPFYAADVTAVVNYPGASVGYIMESDDQCIEKCFFVPGIVTPQMYPEHKKRLRLSKVDEVVISEVLKDLQAIAEKSTK